MTAGLGASTLAAGIKLSLPVLFAALGGMFTHQVNVFNIALESLMLVSAFFATVGSYYTSNPWIGLLFGVLSSILIALLFALLTVDLHADPVVVGIAMNLASWGVTSILLELMFGVRGFLLDPRIKSFPIVRIPGLESIPFVGEVLSGQNLLAYLALATAVWAYFFTYYSRAGLRIRSLGENPAAAETAGVSPRGYRYLAIVLCGMLAGIAGTCLPLSGLSMFSENMSAGKGYIALAAVLFGRGMPGPLIMASLLFGCAEALAVRMQGFGLPNQIMLMIPYIMTMVFLFLGTRETRRRSREG
jgi:ABC-type uncharacterized transport system permease subunit